MPAPDHEREFLDALESIGGKQKVLLTLDEETTSVVEDASPDQEMGASSVADVGAVTLKNLWRHPDAHPIVLDLLLLQQYGPEWLEWETETLQVRIPEDFKTQVITDLNVAKVQACKTLHLVDSYWQRWEVFLWCTMSFNAEFPDFRVMQVPTVAQVLVSVDAATRIREDVDWSDELRAYVQQVYVHDGILLPLPPADFTVLEAPEGFDAADLAKRWATVRSSDKAPTGETVMDEQLRRLLVAHTYLESSRSRLQHQLRLAHV